MEVLAGESVRLEQECLFFIPHKTVDVRLVLSLHYLITGLKLHSHVILSKHICFKTSLACNILISNEFLATIL